MPAAAANTTPPMTTALLLPLLDLLLPLLDLLPPLLLLQFLSSFFFFIRRWPVKADAAVQPEQNYPKDELHSRSETEGCLLLLLKPLRL